MFGTQLSSAEKRINRICNLIKLTGAKLVMATNSASKHYIEDITRWCEDMNFIFEWQNNILRTSAATE